MGPSGSGDKKKKNRVCIIDDHPVTREGIAGIVNREGDLTVCCEAGTIQEAMHVIADCRPDFAIVDLALEKSNGIRLIENISRSFPDMQILVYSMHDELLYAERCIKSGARGYIMKQESSRKFLLALRTVLIGKIYVSDRLSDKILYSLSAGKNKYHASPLELLGNRELEIYQLIGQGLKKREIAENMSISLKTVENHIEHIKKKMGLRDFHDLLRNAVQNSNGALE